MSMVFSPLKTAALSVLALVPALAQSVTVYPATATLPVGYARPFTAYMHSSLAPCVWSVNDVLGGNATLGTITAEGMYQAPKSVPANNVLTIKCTSTVNAEKFGSSALTLMQLTPYLLGTLPSALTTGQAVFKIYGANFFPNTIATFNGATIPSVYVNGSSLDVTMTLTTPGFFPLVVINAGPGQTKSETVMVEVKAPAPPPPPPDPDPVPEECDPCIATRADAGRLLEQAAFGPSPGDMAAVRQAGLDAWIQAQFAAPETPFNAPAADPNSLSLMRAEYLTRLASAPDQLRQRVVFALSQIWVVSANKNAYPVELIPWLRSLSKNAFGNYRTLMRDMTLNPSYGKYLDLANSAKPGMMGGANENYARELLQLFALGTQQLNADGTVKTGADGKPLPVYNESDVKQLSLALTGWTYATPPGGTPKPYNWEYFGAEMEPRPDLHDTTAKSFLGCSLPAGATPEEDLSRSLDCVFNHPNLPPFIVTRLIRLLVSSNPSPAYVARAAQAFINNGAGVRGDMQAVLRTILLDPEARTLTPPPGSGRLRDPVSHTLAFVRAVKGIISPTSSVNLIFVNMGQTLFTAPSVFNWYNLTYQPGPEFQIYSPTEAALRANFLFGLIAAPNNPDIKLDLTPFTSVYADPVKLVDAVDQILFYGRMPAETRSAILAAVQPTQDNTQRMVTALLLAATSGEYLIQH